jgi:amino acid transporter
MASTGEVQPTAPQPGVLQTLRQPRIVLILLAIWAILGVVAQVLSESVLFDMKAEASGILGGRALSASMVVPAIIYLWAARDPERHRQVFWLALVEQVVLVLSCFYHRGAKDISWAGTIIPAVISGGLILLVFFNLFQTRQEVAPPVEPPTYSP